MIPTNEEEEGLLEWFKSQAGRNWVGVLLKFYF
jgi:hypothetical protein